MDAISASDAAKLAMGKFIYETLLYNDDLTDEDKGEIVDYLYSVVKNMLGNNETLQIVDSIYDFLKD